MSVLDSAREFVGFLSDRGHINKDVEIAYEPSGETSSMVFDQSLGKYVVSLSDANSLYHELSHIILKEDGIEPLFVMLDPAAPEYAGHIAGSAIPNFYVNSLLQYFLDGDAPEGVLKGIELYRMDKEVQFKRSMTLMNLCASGNRVLAYYDLFSALSVARSLQLPDITVYLERLAGEADSLAGGSLSAGVSSMREFVRALPDYASMKALCSESPLPQAELTVGLFGLLAPGFSLDAREVSRDRISYFIK